MKWEKIMKTKLETPESVTPYARKALKPPASLGCVQVEANFKYSILGQNSYSADASGAGGLCSGFKAFP